MIGEKEHDGIVLEPGAIQFLEDRTHHVIGPSDGAGIGCEVPADLREVG